MRSTTVVTLLCLLALSLAGCAHGRESAEDRQSEKSGIYDGPEYAAYRIARNGEELVRLIRVFGRDRLPEKFDLDTQMLVAIGMGRKPTGGHAVHIEDAYQRADTLYIRYRERVPGRGQYVTQALTAPYHIKALPRTTASKVMFEKICEPEVHAPDN